MSFLGGGNTGNQGASNPVPETEIQFVMVLYGIRLIKVGFLDQPAEAGFVRVAAPLKV